MSHKVITRFTQECSLEESLSLLADLARLHAEKAGPYTNELIALLDRKDFASLVHFDLAYDRFDNFDQAVHARQCLGFFQKLEPLDIGIDKESTAYDKFILAEDQCRQTNARFRSLFRTGVYPRSDFAAILHRMQSKIAEILGDVPKLADLKYRFGPGANTTVKARASTPRWKLGAKLACSSELLGTASLLLEEMPAWCELHQVEDNEDSYTVQIEIHEGKLQFVPKNAKTYRSIVVEPILNSVGQLAIGGFLKQKLRSFRCDLSDQSRNQQLARKGSLTGSLATVDLSSASDTISRELVANLLPLDWYLLLSDFRTGRVQYKGSTILLEKFSSMGNGFTFELESLIFYSASLAVCEYLHLPTIDVSVYGDDIIVPTEAYKLLSDVLEFCGFSLNQEKSFHSGPFRESCGTDWYMGIDIRPFYQKTLVSGMTLFTLHNYYMRNFEFEFAVVVKKFIHASLHLYGPDGYGDGHLIGDWRARRNRRIRECGYEGGLFDTFRLRPILLLGLN